MKKAYLLFVCLSGIFLNLSAQNDPVLFYYGDEAVTKSEFEFVYQKNNSSNGNPTARDLKDYLDLYINFKLKVKEAGTKRIDTLPKVAQELQTYQNQLLQSYIEKEILDDLVKELHSRMQEDVHIKHIQANLKSGASPEDTLQAYQKVMQARQRLLRGDDFETVAQELSEDQYVSQNKGDLGFITSPLRDDFYAFESAAYNTAVGHFSMPVRSPLGYHVIKVEEKRPAIGKIQAAHILVQIPQNANQNEIERQRKLAEEVYEKVQSGEDFSELAMTYSEDKQSARQGGQLEPFGAGQMVPEFEEAAFALKNDGDVSGIIQTDYGFHIIKRLSKIDAPSLEIVKKDFDKRLKSGPRFESAKNALINSYKRNNSFLEFPGRLVQVSAYLDSSVFQYKYKAPPEGKILSQPLFILGEEKYTVHNFLHYIESNQRKVQVRTLDDLVKRHYHDYLNQAVLETGIAKNYPEYERLKGEYKDGIVMFELMETMVWNKAVADTAGLLTYYEANKTDYMWPQRVDADIFTITDEKLAKKVMKKARKKSDKWILEKYNDDPESPAVEIEEGFYVKGENEMIDNTGWQEGWGKMVTNDNEMVKIVRVNEILEPEPKKLHEARGFFIADYQDYLEKEWLKELKLKYPVRVQENVLKNLFN